MTATIEDKVMAYGMARCNGKCWLIAALAFGPLVQAAAADGYGLKLRDDFDAGGFSPAGGLFYKDNAEQASGKVEFQSGDVHEGHGALTLSVRPGCKPGDEHCSERAEVWEKAAVFSNYDREVWYAFSMKLADPVPQDDHRYVMAQWKRAIIPGAPGDFSPFLALRLNKGRLVATIEGDETTVFDAGGTERPGGCLNGEGRANGRLDLLQTRTLVAVEAGSDFPQYGGFTQCAPKIQVIARGAGLPRADSGWIDFVFAVKPGPRGGGHIEIAANGQWVATVLGRFGHKGAGLGSAQYFKFGPYRAAHEGTWTIHYDAFRRGPKCGDVAAAALCKSMGADR